MPRAWGRANLAPTSLHSSGLVCTRFALLSISHGIRQLLPFTVSREEPPYTALACVHEVLGGTTVNSVHHPETISGILPPKLAWKMRQFLHGHSHDTNW